MSITIPSKSYEHLVQLIHAYNQMWKNIQMRETPDSISETGQGIASLVSRSSSLLRHRKDMTQLYLLKTFPERCHLQIDPEEHGMYSIVLPSKVMLSSGVNVGDACHIPIKKVEQCLSSFQIQMLKGSV